MASFTGVGDNVELAISGPVGQVIDIALSGTYDMTILFQRAVTPDGGAWETLRSYSTANATVADIYYSKRPKEKVRLIVSVDTSGTCTATLTDDSNVSTQQLRDVTGVRVDVQEKGVAADEVYVRRAPVTITAATALTREDHEGRPLFINNATGFKIQLPNATGSGDVYDFYVVTKVTSGSHELNAFEVGDDDVNGVIVGVDPPGDEFTWGAQGTENMVSLGGTSNATGGFQGDHVKFTDIKAGLWAVEGTITQDGTEATPFGTDS